MFLYVAVPRASALCLRPRMSSFSVSEDIIFSKDEAYNWPCSSSQVFKTPHSFSSCWKHSSRYAFGSRIHSFSEFSGARTYLMSLRPCGIKKENSDRNPSGESIILHEQRLERALQAAIKEEDYEQAAEIRDSLRYLHKDARASVLAANSGFYNSFRNGDLGAMENIWAKGENVCCVHPGVSGIYGHDLVMGSWELVMADYEFPLEIELKDVQVHARGDMGYVTCVEMVKTKGVGWGRQFASNVFERIEGGWFISVHHASCIDL